MAEDSIIGTLDVNDRVSVTDISGEWYHIVCEGQVGWVYGLYLSDCPRTSYEETHLLSSAGVDKSYKSAFDYSQAHGSFSNIKELDKLYLVVRETAYKFNEKYQCNMSFDYRFEAVIDMRSAIWNMDAGESYWQLVIIAVAMLAAFFIGLVIIYNIWSTQNEKVFKTR